MISYRSVGYLGRQAIWAARAKLLARLRPFAAPGAPSAGTAPLELVPEVFRGNHWDNYMIN